MSLGSNARALREQLAPFLDLKGYGREDLGKDLVSALTVTFMTIPQGVAYAIIAGLPPAMGLYASCVPTIVGALFRSSNHVVAGPTNALSLLVGTTGAAAAGLDPVSTVLLLSFLVGAMQVTAGVLRLGLLVDWISTPVVIGYITGAGILIGVGQLPSLTETAGAEGNLFEKLWGWSQHLDETNGWALLVGAIVAGSIVGLRRLDKRVPGPMVALTLATLASWLLDFEALGLRRIEDLAPVPASLPPLTLPDGEAWSFDRWLSLLPLAGAVTVLSLVESSSVARAIAARTRQRLDVNTEFSGQGLANVAAAFFGGYPVSGSLSRSALNHQSGARTRLAGVMNGLLLIPLLLFMGPAIDFAPIAALAGLLLVVAADLVDVERILQIVKARPSDAFAFGVTVLGTWILRLDQAIYVGVAVSLVLFLRRARMLTVHQIVFEPDGRVRELTLDDPDAEYLECANVKVLNVEGQLFFGAAGELQQALDEVMRDPAVRAVILRLRRAKGLDVTTIGVLEEAAGQLAAEGRHLFLVGLQDQAQTLLERTGAAELIGTDHVFPTTLRWFQAADLAMAEALEHLGDHDCGDACPLARHLAVRDITPPLDAASSG
ncbi:MAG TPA: SulP family inorganic anion transporter [Sandaracinaceae bacterium LLY-WYZ-13_1]|nr:SulP family inorganic anion transporter [Sandaracinaceae bacterium LLY-WYZ-13_1]